MKSKLFSLIVSVLAAMCLWVYVMTVVNPDVDLTIGNIPVTFSGAEVLREDHGLVITGDYQEFVSVHFYGKNADLKTLDQHKDELKAVIDVSKVRSTKDYTMSYDITLPSAVSASSITKMDKSPANITFTVERQIRKSVEVRGDFSSVKIAEGYMLDSTSFDFDSHHHPRGRSRSSIPSTTSRSPSSAAMWTRPSPNPSPSCCWTRTARRSTRRS